MMLELGFFSEGGILKGSKKTALGLEDSVARRKRRQKGGTAEVLFRHSSLSFSVFVSVSVFS